MHIHQIPISLTILTGLLILASAVETGTRSLSAFGLPIAAGIETAPDVPRKPTIVPLTSNSPLEQEPALDDLNQCAGTMQRYRLPRTNYEPASASRESLAGRQLYDKHNCASCHAVSGRGGTLGPPLDGIGGHRGSQWLVARLLDPEQQVRDFPDVFAGRPNVMPHPSVSKRQARQIAQYLLTLPEPRGGFLVTAHAGMSGPPTPPEEHPRNIRENRQRAEQGRQVFMERGCAMCHSVDSSGNRFGPNLAGIGLRRDQAALEKLFQGGARNPVMKSQALELNDEDAQSIIDFLFSLPPLKEGPPQK